MSDEHKLPGLKMADLTRKEKALLEVNAELAWQLHDATPLHTMGFGEIVDQQTYKSQFLDRFLKNSTKTDLAALPERIASQESFLKYTPRPVHRYIR